MKSLLGIFQFSLRPTACRQYPIQCYKQTRRRSTTRKLNWGRNQERSYFVPRYYHKFSVSELAFRYEIFVNVCCSFYVISIFDFSNCFVFFSYGSLRSTVFIGEYCFVKEYALWCPFATGRPFSVDKWERKEMEWCNISHLSRRFSMP